MVPTKRCVMVLVKTIPNTLNYGKKQTAIQKNFISGAVRQKQEKANIDKSMSLRSLVHVYKRSNCHICSLHPLLSVEMVCHIHGFEVVFILLFCHFEAVTILQLKIQA